MYEHVKGQNRNHSHSKTIDSEKVGSSSAQLVLHGTFDRKNMEK